MSEAESKNFTVYRSSAGSGKTFTLVKEYLKIVLKDPPRFRNILAITFTNKAAFEMKERIITYLNELSALKYRQAHSSSGNLLKILMEETSLSEGSIIFNAGECLSLILHNYSDFAISTIDSFVHRVIRSFALELGLSMNFEVEMDSEELITKCVDLLLDRAGDDELLTKELISFMFFKSSQDLNLDITRDLVEFGKTLGSESVQRNIAMFRDVSPEDYEKVLKKTRSFIAKFEKDTRSLADEALKCIEDESLSADAFFQKSSGIISFFRKVSNSNFDKPLPGSKVFKIVEEDKWINNSASVEEVEKIEAIKPMLLSYYNRIIDKLDKELRTYKTYHLLNKNIYRLALLNQLEKVMEEYKKQNNLLLITEFNKKISEIVFSEPVPFIYEKIGERYKYFFIDEFQDTSVLQWMNLLPLLDNSLGEANFNLVVGDGKQAIYRWRNGEVEQFLNLPQIQDSDSNPYLKERESSLVRNYNEQKLNTNYRSGKNIVYFVNKLFSFINERIMPHDWRSVYNDHEQNVNPAKGQGYVNIFFAENDDKEGYQNITHEKILETIKNQIDLGYNYRDIAILCRTKKALSKIAKYLTNNNIPSVSSESLLLASSPSVSYLIACVKLMSDPDNRILREEVNRFIRSRNDEDTAAKYSEKIFSSMYYLNKLNTYELCEELIRLSGLNKDVDPYMHYFLDVIFEFESKHNSGDTDFNEWWEEKKEKSFAVVPEETNAVRLMTIHKSKGLEFPVVIYPYASAKLNTRFKGYFWIPNKDVRISELPMLMLPQDKSISETDHASYYDDERNKTILDLLNLLYVVTTRAEEKLFIISEKVNIGDLENKSLDNPEISVMLAYFLSSREMLKENQSCYEFGDDYAKEGNKEYVETGSVSLKDYISFDWRKRALISLRAPEIWDMEEPERNRKWGNLIHKLLSDIKTVKDVEPVLSKFYSDGSIEENERKELHKKINSLLGDPVIKPLFSDQVVIKNEAEILLPDGNSYRPDRVVINDNQVIVIDYKTGKRSDSHIKQIKSYASLLKEMGYDVTKKYLIYIDEKIEVEDV